MLSFHLLRLVYFLSANYLKGVIKSTVIAGNLFTLYIFQSLGGCYCSKKSVWEVLHHPVNYNPANFVTLVAYINSRGVILRYGLHRLKGMQTLRTVK